MRHNTATIGLALGSGGWRGLAHIGVIKSLLFHGFEIGAIAGTSAGSLVGGLYALWNDIDRVEAAFAALTYRDLLAIFADPAQRLGLVRGKKTLQLIEKHTRSAAFSDCAIPFRAVATDVISGTPYVFREGDLASAMRASSSVPIVFVPVEREGKLLVDGAISNPVPVGVARDMGASIIVAVNVYENLFPRPNDGKPLSRIALGMLCEQIMLKELASRDARGADLVVEPALDSALTDDFRGFVNNPTAVARGREAMDALIPRLQRLLASSSGRE